MPFGRDRTLTVPLSLALTWLCISLLGMDVTHGHAKPYLDDAPLGKSVSLQPSNSMASVSNITVEDMALSRDLLDVELLPDQPLCRTESVQLHHIHSFDHPPLHFAKPVHFQSLGTALPVADLYFDLDRVRLGYDLTDVLDRSVDAFSDGMTPRIKLEAYCDQRGGMAYSLALGARRLEMVRKYFLDLGVPPDGVQSVNYGAMHPSCRSVHSRCQQSNLRIQATLTFFAIVGPKFGCLTRIKLVPASGAFISEPSNGQSVLHRRVRLAPLLKHK